VLVPLVSAEVAGVIYGILKPLANDRKELKIRYTKISICMILAIALFVTPVLAGFKATSYLENNYKLNFFELMDFRK